MAEPRIPVIEEVEQGRLHFAPAVNGAEGPARTCSRGCHSHASNSIRRFRPTCSRRNDTSAFRSLAESRAAERRRRDQQRVLVITDAGAEIPALCITCQRRLVPSAAKRRPPRRSYEVSFLPSLQIPTGGDPPYLNVGRQRSYNDEESRCLQPGPSKKASYSRFTRGM
jgi:hypothetical protein